MENRLVVLVIACIIGGLVAGSVLTFALMQWTHRISNVAILKVLGVGVFKDVNFTVTVTQIDWGMLEPGESKYFEAYVRNEGNVPIVLAMRTEEWNPLDASALINVAWGCEGVQLPVDGFVPATFTLHVDPGASGIRSFSFTIVIIGS